MNNASFTLNQLFRCSNAQTASMKQKKFSVANYFRTTQLCHSASRRSKTPKTEHTHMGNGVPGHRFRTTKLYTIKSFPFQLKRWRIAELHKANALLNQSSVKTHQLNMLKSLLHRCKIENIFRVLLKN